jgi:drug/metabolite transporter (DMT)-like permease
MPIGLGLGLFAALMWGAVDVTAALSTRMVGSLRVLVGSQLVTLAVLLALAALDPALLGPTALEGVLAGLPLGLLASATYLAYFTALRIGPVSIVSPVIVAYGGTTVVLAVIFRGETLTTGQAAGAILATAGVVLVGVTFEAGSLRGARIVSRGVLAALLTMLGFAVLSVLLAGPIGEHGWLGVAIGSRIGNSAASVLLFTVAVRAGSSRFGPLLIPWHGWSRLAIVLVLATGVFDVVGLVAFAIGLEVAQTWLVGLASSFGPVLAVGYAVARMGERPHRTQWMGLAGILLGVVVLAVTA